MYCGFKNRNMKTKEQVEKEFREDLETLLKKHKAEIALSQRGSAYMEYDVIEVTIDAVYNTETFEEDRPMIEFNL
tara:strand:+ start:369 stop:593 length:225 start_codon:yes stop_codon:yes gene_type:complete